MLSKTRTLVISLAVLALAGCQDRPTGAGATTATAKATVYGRAEFKRLLLGKTPDEVLAAVGKPETTSEQERRSVWYYRDRTRDPVTGKVDFQAMVVFRDGVVDEVVY
jgi:outer membrane protein assembly factor BamE (lipoprotein component of BamABCDE complex)